MPDPPPTAGKPGKPRSPGVLWTTAVAVSSLLLALISLQGFLGERAVRGRLAAALGPLAATEIGAEAGNRIRLEEDLEKARLALVRALIAGELDPELAVAAATGDPEADAAAARSRLETARLEAAAAWSRRPAAWEAPMLLGAATYLAWSREQNPRLFTTSRAWDGPLNRALELAPSKEQPGRFLVTAYLELWPALAPEKREQARRLLRKSFEDPATFRRLIDPWLGVARDRTEALASIPDDPDAWNFLLDRFARDGDWRSYREARDHWRRAVESHIGRDLAEADRMLAFGEPVPARARFLRAAAQCLHERRFAPLLARALETAPPGPAAGASALALRALLEWVLEQGLYGEYPLGPRQIDRLTVLAGELPAPTEALASLVAGRLSRAESLELRSTTLWSEDWTPYFLVKARLFLARSDLEEAAAALDAVPPASRQGVLFRLAERELAERRGGGDLPRAEARVAELATASWPDFAWSRSATRASLEMLTERPAGGLLIALRRAPEAGAPVEVALDGHGLGTYVVRSAGVLVVDTEIEPGLHLLELRALAQRVAEPGEVWLLRSG